MHSHRHEHGHHGHSHADHAGDAKNGKVLIWAVALTLLFAVIEAAAGVWSHSLALLSDAGHMITDSTALALALLAQHIARRPPSAKHSFGLARAEALAAFINALAMLAVVGWIGIEAVQRFSAPAQVHGETVLVVALIGMAINIAVAWVLSRDRHSVNTRAALIHVMGDLLGSVAALIAGLVIHFTGWLQIDPLLSLLVSLLILKSTVDVLRESYHFLMQGVPHEIDYVQVGADLARVQGVLSVHDLHVWEMTPGEPALIGRVEVRDLQEWPTILGAVQRMLLEKHGIGHVTLQPELPGMAQGH